MTGYEAASNTLAGLSRADAADIVERPTIGSVQ